VKGISELRRLDAFLLSSAVALSLFGIAVIRSATSGGVYETFPGRQAYWLIIGIAPFFMGYYADRRHLERGAYLFYGIVLTILFGLFLTGRITGGIQRWIHVGGLTFQPSELAKITLILALARYFSGRRIKPPCGLKDIAVPLLLVAAYALPVALQPDLGTAVFLIMLSIPVFLYTGIRRSTVLALGFAAAAAVPMLFFSMKDYQRERILNFLNPERDPLGAGYHVIQSKIAIGSGGLLGKGFQQGTQSQLRFIPEQHTDFIFSVLAEEFGFVGVMIVLGLMLFLALHLLSYLEFAKTRFSTLVVVGITCAFVMQTTINITMSVGLLPVVGLPLPLLSYGGSSLIVTYLGFGIIAGYKRRR
jgi:rod shape determining protein RodA